MTRVQHDRTEEHSGYDADLVITISAVVGSNPVGTDLHTVLAYIDSWISDRETITPAIGSVTANSIIKRTVSSSVTSDAIVRRVSTVTLTADAFVLGYLRLNAVVLATISGSFTIRSEIVDLYYFRINAVIVTDATAFDASAFDPDAFA